MTLFCRRFHRFCMCRCVARELILDFLQKFSRFNDERSICGQFIALELIFDLIERWIYWLCTHRRCGTVENLLEAKWVVSRRFEWVDRFYNGLIEVSAQISPSPVCQFLLLIPEHPTIGCDDELLGILDPRTHWHYSCHIDFEYLKPQTIELICVSMCTWTFTYIQWLFRILHFHQEH